MSEATWGRIVGAVEVSRLRPHRWRFARPAGSDERRFTRQNPGVCVRCGAKRWYSGRVNGGQSPRHNGSLPDALADTDRWAEAIQCPAVKERSA